MTTTTITKSVAETDEFRAWGATHVGTVRTGNQDAFLNRPDLGLWVVADGAGGHDDGALASAMTVEALHAIEPGLAAPDMLAEVRARLLEVHGRLRVQGAAQGPGHLCLTTVVALLIRDGHFACVWAGDSRAYLWRRGALTRLTRDHSLVEELVQAGTITEAEAEHHPHANVITRALGADLEALELDKSRGPLETGDRLLLCSDGLSKVLPASALAAILAEDEDAAAERLVLAALTAGTTDNVTAVTIELPQGPA